jgi:amidophosphoribosyltransferase
MAKLGDFIAFRAAVELLKETGKVQVLLDTYSKCKQELTKEDAEMTNAVKDIYKDFTDQQISNKIAQLLTSESIKAKVEIIYQSVANLHRAIPNHKGDWYFTGDYPTPGGNRVVNEAFVNYYEGKNTRAY